jgi:cystathionine beta-lyase
VNQGGRYAIDFERLDDCLCRSRALLFCSPHNPVGRVWSREEYGRVAALCEHHGVLLLADEIHSDLIMPGGPKNIPSMTLGGDVGKFTVTMLSATKTFNLAQNGIAFIYTENSVFETKIRALMTAMHLGAMNVFAAAAVEAAYEHGGEWLDQVLAYIQGNYRRVVERIASTMPQLSVSPLEGTYLVWVDCRRLGVPPAEFFERNAKIYGDDGILFGADGEGYYRLNLATPRCVVDEMLARTERAYRARLS